MVREQVLEDGLDVQLQLHSADIPSSIEEGEGGVLLEFFEFEVT